MGTKDIPPKNKPMKRNQEILNNRVLELTQSGYSKENAAKIADIEHVIAATEERKMATAEDASLNDEIKEKRLLVNDKTLIENNRRLEELMAEKKEMVIEQAPDTINTINTASTEVDTKKEEPQKKTEDQEFEDIRKKIAENSEKTANEAKIKFDEKIGNIYEKTEKNLKENQEAFNTRLNAIKNRLDENFGETKKADMVTDKKEVNKETTPKVKEKPKIEGAKESVESLEIEKAALEKLIQTEKIKVLEAELKIEKDKLEKKTAKPEEVVDKTYEARAAALAKFNKKDTIKENKETKEKEKTAEANGNEKILSEQLDASRAKYAEGYKKFLADRKKNSSWYANLGRKMFGSKVKEGETPQYLKDLEKEYEKNAMEYAKNMYSEKEAELKNSKLTEKEQKTEIKRYKGYEIFTKVIAEEGDKLNALKAENLPIKEKGIWKKSLDWYIKQPRWKKIAISTVLSTGIIAAASSGSIAAAGGIAAYAGTKYVRGFAGSVVGQSAAKAWDWLFTPKAEGVRKQEEKDLAEDFTKLSFEKGFEKAKKEYAEITERERKAKRQRLVTKAAITLVAGGLASYEMGNVLHTISPDQALAGDNLQKPSAAPAIHEIKPEFKTESVGYSSRGAIQTIHDLKTQISHDYPDITKAPANVQEFMKTDSTQEAIKLGMYDPNSPAESMIVQKGTLSFENGVLKTHYLDMKGVEHDQVLMKGTGVEQYKGDMFDSDKSGAHAVNPAEHPTQNMVQEQNPAESHGPYDPTHEQGHAIPEGNQNPNMVQEQNPAASTDTKISGTNPPTEHIIKNMIKEQNPVETTGEIVQTLTHEQLLDQVTKIRVDNLNHLFGKNTTLWDNVKDSHSQSLTANKMMHLNTEGMTEDTKKLVTYLNKLHEVTGLSPLEETLTASAETNSEFIERALEKAASDPQIGLDKVTL